MRGFFQKKVVPEKTPIQVSDGSKGQQSTPNEQKQGRSSIAVPPSPANVKPSSTKLNVPNLNVANSPFLAPNATRPALPLNAAESSSNLALYDDLHAAASITNLHQYDIHHSKLTTHYPAKGASAREHQLHKYFRERFAGLTESRKKSERKYGYGDLKYWNSLPAADQERIRGHSEKLKQAFRNTKWFLRGLARFPFISKKLEDGSYTFQMSPWNIFYILFVLSSIIVIVVFVLFTLGGIFIYILVDPKSQLHDRCGNSWGTTILSRNLPLVIFVWSELMMIVAGSVYVLINGQSFLDYYNVVNEAVMQLDIDPTQGMLSSDIRGMIVFGSLFLAGGALAFTGKSHSLEEVSAFVVQCICFFFAKDIYNSGNSKAFKVADYEELLPKCGNVCAGCYEGKDLDSKRCHQNNCYNIINTPTFELKLAKWLGLVIMGYAILAARALIRQFEFFCQILVNLQSVWNKRFLNYASKDNSINMEDPYRRRITSELILKDHFEIVKLYNETEQKFSVVLFGYYFMVFFNLIVQFYFAALLNSQVTCATAVKNEKIAAQKGLCNQESTDLVLNGTYYTHQVSFEDACSIAEKSIIRHSMFTTLLLLVVTLITFIITTLSADRASKEANIGFYRVRKKGYLTCKTRKERNAMHSLVFSFTGPKPFCITAAKYFPIRKKTIVTVISCAFIYFLIILSLKPGSNVSNFRCYTYHENNTDYKIYQTKYQDVIF